MAYALKSELSVFFNQSNAGSVRYINGNCSEVELFCHTWLCELHCSWKKFSKDLCAFALLFARMSIWTLGAFCLLVLRVFQAWGRETNDCFLMLLQPPATQPAKPKVKDAQECRSSVFGESHMPYINKSFNYALIVSFWFSWKNISGMSGLMSLIAILWNCIVLCCIVSPIIYNLHFICCNSSLKKP